MFQRIQSVYLILSLVLTGVLPFIFPLWEINDVAVFAKTEIIYFGFLMVVTAITFISLLQFKKRQTQFVLNRLSIIFNFILLGLFVYRLLNLSGEMEISEKGIGMFLPTISIVLLVLANKAIKKDEDLVKSVDRLR